jgi:hypothetical protein
VIEVSDWARDILGRSQEAARRFDSNVAIRLTRTGSGVQAVLAAGPEPDDQVIELDSMTLYVEEGLEGLVDVEEPHDRLVLKAPGSAPNSRSH